MRILPVGVAFESGVIRVTGPATAEVGSGGESTGPRLGKRLSPGARAAWAKSSYADDGYLPLWRHMSDSAATAGLLWDRWLPEQLKRLVAQALPGGFADARALAVWLAGVHDAGKATPAFACQVEPLAEKMRRAGLAMPTMRQFGEDRRDGLGATVMPGPEASGPLAGRRKTRRG
ncbi:HD domain-containing protein [Streptomyces albus]|uniref:HD domain-containing protein n=1 Tax=Streptomyces albus TaxID=1888 RepID=UPI003F1BA172